MNDDTGALSFNDNRVKVWDVKETCGILVWKQCCGARIQPSRCACMAATSTRNHLYTNHSTHDTLWYSHAESPLPPSDQNHIIKHTTIIILVLNPPTLIPILTKLISVSLDFAKRCCKLYIFNYYSTTVLDFL